MAEIDVTYEDGVEPDGSDPAPTEPPAYPGWPAAKVYVEIARAVIASEFTPESGLTRWDVRTWWRDEAEHRKENRLSAAQEADLKDRCRAACEPLPEGAKNPDEWPDEQKKPRKTNGGRGRRPVV